MYLIKMTVVAGVLIWCYRHDQFYVCRPGESINPIGRDGKVVHVRTVVLFDVHVHAGTSCF